MSAMSAAVGGVSAGPCARRVVGDGAGGVAPRGARRRPGTRGGMGVPSLPLALASPPRWMPCHAASKDVSEALGDVEELMAKIQGGGGGRRGGEGAVGDSLDEVSRMLSSLEKDLGAGRSASSSGQAELVCDDSGCVIVGEGAEGVEDGAGAAWEGGVGENEDDTGLWGQGNLVCDENGCMIVPDVGAVAKADGMRMGGREAAFGEAFVEHRGQGWRFVERGAASGGGGVLGSEDFAVTFGGEELDDLRVLLTSLTKNVAMSAKAHEDGENWRAALDVQTKRVRVRAVVSGSKEAASAGAQAAAAAMPKAAAAASVGDLPADLRQTLGHFEVRFSLLEGRAVDFRLPAVAVLEMVQSMGLAPN